MIVPLEQYKLNLAGTLAGHMIMQVPTEDMRKLLAVVDAANRFMNEPEHRERGDDFLDDLEKALEDLDR